MKKGMFSASFLICLFLISLISAEICASDGEVTIYCGLNPDNKAQINFLNQTQSNIYFGYSVFGIFILFIGGLTFLIYKIRKQKQEKQ
jgi:hypothetical protein